MAAYWRLTRNTYARSVIRFAESPYDALKALGITATRMYEYRAELNRMNSTRSPDTPARTSLEFVHTTEMDSHEVDVDFSLPVDILDGEWAVIASIDGRPVGRTLVTDTPDPHVDPLERALPISGAYIRRVFVVPE